MTSDFTGSRKSTVDWHRSTVPVYLLSSQSLQSAGRGGGADDREIDTDVTALRLIVLAAEVDSRAPTRPGTSENNVKLCPRCGLTSTNASKLGEGRGVGNATVISSELIDRASTKSAQ